MQKVFPCPGRKMLDSKMTGVFAGEFEFSGHSALHCGLLRNPMKNNRVNRIVCNLICLLTGMDISYFIIHSICLKRTGKVNLMEGVLWGK